MVKVAFFSKKSTCLQVSIGGNRRKWVKNGVFWPKIDFYSENGVILNYITNFTPISIKSLDGVMVSTLNSHPADRVSILLIFSYFFLFFLVISSKNQVLSIKKSKTQLKNCSFNFIILSFLCMHISHIMKKRSHKVWVISVCYRFILEQCASAHILSIVVSVTIHYIRGLLLELPFEILW